MVVDKCMDCHKQCHWSSATVQVVAKYAAKVRSGRMQYACIWLVFCAAPMLLCGCADPPPELETHAVTGTVTFSNGEPVQSGTIDFRSKKDQRLSMNGEILEDGTFEISTIYKNSNLTGAVEGPCSVIVTVMLPGNPIPVIADLPETYDVKPGANDFQIKLPLPAPK